MALTGLEELYERHIKPLPPAERIRLIAMTARDLAPSAPEGTEARERSLMELEGLGADLWQGVEAQEYVNELRKEWDHRP